MYTVVEKKLKSTRPQTKGLFSEYKLEISIRSNNIHEKVLVVSNITPTHLRLEAHDGYKVIQGQIIKRGSVQRMTWTNEWINMHKDPWLRLMDNDNNIALEMKLDGRY